MDLHPSLEVLTITLYNQSHCYICLILLHIPKILGLQCFYVILCLPGKKYVSLTIVLIMKLN